MSMREAKPDGGLVDALNGAIRDNPLAAGLIGAGIAWTLFGGRKGIGSAAKAAQSAARKTGSTAASVGSALASGVAAGGSRVAAGIKDASANVADSVASIVPDLSGPDTDQILESAAAETSSIRSDISAAGRKHLTAIQSQLSDVLERQPLMLGVIGVAIGAGLASTFATTAVEGEWMGKNGTTIRKKLQAVSEDATERVRHVAAEEAEHRGWTADTAKNAAIQLANKMKTVASASSQVRSSATEPPKGGAPSH